MYDIFEQLLQERGMTPYQISKETGIAQSTLSGWKTTGGTPQLRTIKKIADYFGVSVAYLKGETEDRGQKNTPSREVGREMGDDEIKAAFWGGDKDLSPTEVDELWADAKEYIKFKTEQQKKRRL